MKRDSQSQSRSIPMGDTVEHSLEKERGVGWLALFRRVNSIYLLTRGRWTVLSDIVRIQDGHCPQMGSRIPNDRGDGVNQPMADETRLLEEVDQGITRYPGSSPNSRILVWSCERPWGWGDCRNKRVKCLSVQPRNCADYVTTAVNVTLTRPDGPRASSVCVYYTCAY